MWLVLPQAEPGKSVGRYNCGLTLTVYPQQQVVLTPQDVAELGRKDMVLLWKVQNQPIMPEWHRDASSFLTDSEHAAIRVSKHAEPERGDCNQAKSLLRADC